MSEHFSWQSAVTRSCLEPSTKLVLLVIGTHMNQHGEGAFPSYKTLAAGTSLNRATVIRHVDMAIAAGWLSKRSRVRQSKASGRLEADSNTYAISFPRSPSATPVVAQDDHPRSHCTTTLVAQNHHPSRTEPSP
ncbi:hypothetical protein XBLMG947_4087 [Xanthomonas bromi]|uniref:Helix-turn-helix domain-containing protein n=1 Tax=Xanthomonas bromi TaxID=56449 RepID=A0A1C3NSA3_9XANT|nr:helix-turn-helix domain-containing protein [Xanthomonas bromi]PPV04722.1 helix-turn-helix domain-containing protein [Xanthomonas bromi]SBV53270.1 hypothetical protein XBLMG947_4087 [Xanthomonas bromi]